MGMVAASPGERQHIR